MSQAEAHGVAYAAEPGDDTARVADRLDYYSGRPERQRKLVLVLTIIAMVGSLDRYALTLLVNPIKADLGISDTQLSVVLGAGFALSQMAFTLPAGYLADRFNRRRLMSAGTAFWSAMTGMTGLAASFWTLLVARAGTGIGECVIQPCTISMVKSAVPAERRGRAMSTIQMGYQSGFSLALVVAGGLLAMFEALDLPALPLVGALHPWQLTLLGFGALGVLAFGLTTLMREPDRNNAEPESGHSYIPALTYIWSNAQRYFPLLGYSICWTLLSASFAAWIATMISRSWSYTPQQVGAILGPSMFILALLGLAISGPIMDKLTSRFDRRGPVIVGGVALALNGVFAFGSGWAPTEPVFWIFMSCLLLVSGVCQPILPTLLAVLTPGHLIGKVAAVLIFLNGIISFALGPTIIAIVSDTFFVGHTAISRALGICAIGFAAMGVVNMLILWRTVDDR